MIKKLIYILIGCVGFTVTSFAQVQSTGDIYQGMTKQVPEGRVIYPYGLEVTFEKTVHLIFPAPIRYVDLGSNNLIAGKALNAENVLRVKASVKDFETETTLSVICEDGSYYAFNVKYAAEPEKLNIEMQDFLTQTGAQRPTNRADIYFKELGSNAPILVQLIMKTIDQNNKKQIRHIGAKQFGLDFSLRGLYTHNGLIYFHTVLKNRNDMSYIIDHVSFRIVDDNVTKKVATQELVLHPLRSYKEYTEVHGHRSIRTVYALEQFTLTEGKLLEVTLHEYNGGRTLTFTVNNEDLLHARSIENLKLRF